MELIRVLEALERYSEETVAYKLDTTFACAVTEAASLLQGMGEQLADAQIELERLRDSRRWVPVTEKMPDLIPCDAGTAYSEAVNVLTAGRKVITAIWDGTEFIGDAEFWEAGNEKITHWTPVLLPLPAPSKEEN